MESELHSSITNNNSDEITLVFSSDDNYIQHLYCAITSIACNKNPSDKINIYIMIDTLKEKNKVLLKKLGKKHNIGINFIPINIDDFKNCPMTSSCPHITIATYYRFVLASVLPNIDKVIYLDCDITVQGSLKDLYDIDITDYYFAGVQDILYKDSSKRMNLEKYCNAGIMLINLKKWREDGIEQKLFNYVIEKRRLIKWQDQDTLNDVLQSGILYLDKTWNAQVGQYPLCKELGFNKIAKTARILHHIGRAKPWAMECRAKTKYAYYKYLMHTPFWYNVAKYIIIQRALACFLNTRHFISVCRIAISQ